MKIEYQSEANFIYHENLRFKKKEKSLRKIKESKRMTKTQGNIYIKSQNKVHTVGRKKLLKQIYIYLTHIQVRESLCQSDCHTICKEITIICA